MDKSLFLNVVSRFYKLIIAVIIMGVFFTYYNIFLIDNTLEALKYSLEQAVVAYDIEDVSGVDMLITKAIAKEIPPYDIISRTNVVNLEYAKSIVNKGKTFKQLGHMKVALNTAIGQTEKRRGFFLTFLDRLNRPIRGGFIHLASMARSFFAPKPVEKASNEIDIN